MAKSATGAVVMPTAFKLVLKTLGNWKPRKEKMNPADESRLI